MAKTKKRKEKIRKIRKGKNKNSKSYFIKNFEVKIRKMKDYLVKTKEIILKGRNRKYFEKILISNIKKRLKANLIDIKNFGGGFWIKSKDEIKEDFKKIFGIANFMEVKIFDRLEDVISYLKKLRKGINLKVKRGNKDYLLTSVEIFKKIKKELNSKINKNDHEIFIEYRKKKFFVGEEKINCYGGLPLGASGKGLVLISTGFDSPVAAFLCMKRGLKLYFLHFHSYPQTTVQSIEKMKEIIKILNEFNLGSKLYLINILDIQKFYLQNVPSKYLVIFYRRTMFRLAKKLSDELKTKVLITGENLGQVSSQTIENICVIENAIINNEENKLILRPLLGFNKDEIIKLADEIGTKKISELPGEDCCSLFIPKKVVTKANLKIIIDIENKFKEKIYEIERKIYTFKEIIKFDF